jgi:hypothetical protein
LQTGSQLFLRNFFTTKFWRYMTAVAVHSSQVPDEVPGKCNALKGNNKRCLRPAGYKTDHLGYSRCHVHGGAAPVTHGRYSSLQHLRIGTKLAKYENDPDPLNILPELAMLRALTEDYLERYEEITRAIVAWHESYISRPVAKQRIEAMQRILDECERRMREYEEPSESEWAALAEARDTVDRLARAQENKPRQILDIATARDLIAETAKTVEKIEKIRSQDAISRPELLRAMTHMGRVVETHVKDPGILDKIRRDWLTLHV